MQQLFLLTSKKTQQPTHHTLEGGLAEHVDRILEDELKNKSRRLCVVRVSNKSIAKQNQKTKDQAKLPCFLPDCTALLLRYFG